MNETEGQNACRVVIRSHSVIVMKSDSIIISVQSDNDSYIPGSLAYRRQGLSYGSWHINNFVTDFKLHRTGCICPLNFRHFFIDDARVLGRQLLLPLGAKVMMTGMRLRNEMGSAEACLALRAGYV